MCLPARTFVVAFRLLPSWRSCQFNPLYADFLKVLYGIPQGVNFALAIGTRMNVSPKGGRKVDAMGNIRSGVKVRVRTIACLFAVLLILGVAGYEYSISAEQKDTGGKK